MSLERYSNIREIRDTPGLSRGLDWFESDQASLKLTQLTSRPDETPVVEMHIYTPTTEVYLGGGPITDFVIQQDKLYIDYAKAFAAYNIKRGFFKININVYYDIVGTYEFPDLKVTEISNDNTELLLTRFVPRAGEPDSNNNIISEFLERYSDPFERDFALNFGENRLLRVINYKSYLNPDTLAVKLYNRPADGDIAPLDRVQIVEIIADSYIDNISLDQLAPTKPQPTLRGPNFEIESGYTTSTETDFKNWNDLLGSNVTTSEKIISSVFSGSLGGVGLGIDYTGFNNFTFYSSAYERLYNFKQKLQNIEYYDSRLYQLNNTSGSSSGSLSVNINNVQKRKDSLIGSFDDFEKWLYYEPTASLFTHGASGGPITLDPDTETFILSPWPKRLVNGQQVLYSSTASISENWYLTASNAAITYDENNPNQLIKTIPEHIRLDSNNSEYETFVNMIAQHFDVLYTYANALTEKVYIKQEHPKLGIDKDVLVDIARSQGWELVNGKQASQLWQYKLGTNQSGSYAQTGSLFTISDEQITSEVWRRIVNNLPYILKSRGTIQSIKALLNIYGIPQTLLSIREYGGPKVSSDEWPVLTEDRYSYAINFNTGSYLEYGTTHVSASIGSPYGAYWGRFLTNPNVIAPVTREFRFRPATTSSMLLYSQVNASGDTLAHIAVQWTGSYSGSAKYGRINIAFGSGSGTSPVTASTDWLPLYNGDFWNLSYGWQTTGEHFNTGSNSDTTYRIRVQHASDYIKGKVSHTGSLAITPSNTNHYLIWSHPSNVTENLIRLGGNTGSGTDNLSVDSYLQNLMGGTLPGTFEGAMQEYREWLEYFDIHTFNDHTLNPTSYVSGLSATGSYDTLVRHYTLGSETIGFNLDTDGTIISSSHPNQSITDFTTTNVDSSNIKAYGFITPTDNQRGNFIPVEETYYIQGVSLGATNPRSEKIRLENNSLIRRLSPVSTGEVSSFDNAPLDSNKLGLFYSFADQVNKDIFNHTGRIELDDYVGDPDDEHEVAYEDLKYFATQYWKKFTNNSDVNAYNRIFSQFDFSIFSQIKQLLPERIDEATGLLIEPNAIERSKVQITKPIKVENPQYDIVFTQQQPTWSADYTNYEAEIIRDETTVLVTTGSYVDEYSDTIYAVRYTGSMNYCTIETLPGDELVTFTASLDDINYVQASDAIDPEYGNQKVLFEPNTTLTPVKWTSADPQGKYDLLAELDRGGNMPTQYWLKTTLSDVSSSSTITKQVRFKYDTSVQYDTKIRVTGEYIFGVSQSNAQPAAEVGKVRAALVELEDDADPNSRIKRVLDYQTGTYSNSGSNANKSSVNFKSVLVPANTNLYGVYQFQINENVTSSFTPGIFVSASAKLISGMVSGSTIVRWGSTFASNAASQSFGTYGLALEGYFSASAADFTGDTLWISSSNSDTFWDGTGSYTGIAPFNFSETLPNRGTLQNGYIVSDLGAGTTPVIRFLTGSIGSATAWGPSGSSYTTVTHDFFLRYHQARITTDEVCHSVKQNYIEDCRLSDIYQRKIYYYSGSKSIANKRERDNDGFLSQSLGLYYSSSVQPACYRDDFLESFERAFYIGTQFRAAGINLPTKDNALDGSPVIEIYEVNPNQLFYNETPQQPGPGNTLDPGNLTVR